MDQEDDFSHGIRETEDKELPQKTKKDFVYGIEDVPHISQLILLGLQLFMSVFSGCIMMPLILSEVLCMETQFVIIAKIISATYFTQGIITILQATFGIRLPIVQGSSFSYIPPCIALMSFYGGCQNLEDDKFNMNNGTTNDDHWKQPFAEINGGLLAASAVELVVGATGLVTLMRRFIGPLCIAPVLILLGISLCQIAWKPCQVHWGISLFTAATIIIFSQFLKNIEVPILSFSREKGIHIVRTRLFLQFSMLLSIICSWFLCYILTVSGALPDEPSERTYRARTDIANEVFTNTNWIGFPYPGEVIWPQPSLAAFLGMFAAVIASIVESLGDYSACAAICDVPSPPDHAVNRGIAIQGLGGILSCIWCTGTGTASYSPPIVLIGITKVASRRVVQMVGLLFVIVGFLKVLTSFFSTIPSPVLGGTLIVKTGMIVSIGISLLQEVNLSSSRNLFVLGLSMFFGIVMPEYLKQNPNAIKTGSPTFNSSATILLETGIFVGFFTSVIFDNLIPGSFEDRGLAPRTDSTEDQLGHEVQPETCTSYELPVGMRIIRKSRFLRYIPISPTFRGFFTHKHPRNGREENERINLTGY